MNIYLVASNSNFTTIVKATSEKKAKELTAQLFDNKYTLDCDMGFTVYPIEEWLEDLPLNKAIEIETTYE